MRATADRLRRARRREWIAAGVVAVSATAIVAVVVALLSPIPSSEAEQLEAYVEANAQTFAADEAPAALAPITRDSFDAEPGIATLRAGGTNYDWAKLVLLYGGWPQTDDNVTVIVRWMRQENYVDSWWTRNNPLNNGWGSGGNAGLGTFANLDIAAQMVAETLHNNTAKGYSDIVAALAASAPTATTETAIWNANWAMSHYEYGGHWAYDEVPVIQAPTSAWG